MKKLPKVIIFGRANVGKSTLLNRLLEQKKALTSKIAGTTRDILIGSVYWQGINFDLMDTGGIETILPSKKLKKLSPDLNRDFALDIIKKTQAALKTADLVLFVVDIQAGLMPQDRNLAQALKKYNKEIILIANKTDAVKLRNEGADFYKLGLGEPVYISAINGSGTGDLLDIIIDKLKKTKKSRQANKFEIKKAVRVSLIGKPNVGKSSLLNAILGEERVIVSPIPFTTREAIDTYLKYKEQNVILIDTAGIRKQAKIGQDLEKFSVRNSLDNARNSDICLLVLDISKPITVQDNKLSQILMEARVGIVIVANKWDLIENKTDKTINDFQKYIYRIFPYLTWAPIIFISAKTKKHVQRVMDLAMEVYQARQTKIKDNALDKFLKQAIKRHKPSQAKGSLHPFLTRLRQVKTNPPEFFLNVRETDTLSQGYLKFLENSLREKFKLIGTPLNISLKKE